MLWLLKLLSGRVYFHVQNYKTVDDNITTIWDKLDSYDIEQYGDGLNELRFSWTYDVVRFNTLDVFYYVNVGTIIVLPTASGSRMLFDVSLRNAALMFMVFFTIVYFMNGQTGLVSNLVWFIATYIVLVIGVLLKFRGIVEPHPPPWI